MGYRFRRKDGEAVMDALNERSASELEGLVDDLGEEVEEGGLRYMAMRSLIEGALMAIIDKYERCTGKEREDALVELTKAMAMVADRAVMEVSRIMTVDDIYDYDPRGDDGLRLDELPDGMLDDIAKAAGMTADELRAKADSLRVKGATIAEDGTLSMVDDDEAREILKGMAPKPAPEPRTMDETMEILDRFRRGMGREEAHDGD